MLTNLVTEKINQLSVMAIIDTRVAERRDQWIDILDELQRM
jgi:hypothetical protein